MRTLLLLAPGLICPGTMFVCFRVMATKQHSGANARHEPTARPEEDEGSP